MIRTNILDKINVLINIVSKEQFMLLMLILYLLLALILLLCNKLTKKSAKKVLACWYTFMLTTIAFEYRDKLSGLLDYLVNNIIYELVFPNYLVFILIFVITNIYIVDSIINKNSTLVYKLINILMYTITTFISFVLFYLITKNNINIYNELDIYINSDIASLIELVMIIFSIWTIINILCKITHKVYINNKKEDLQYAPVNMDVPVNMDMQVSTPVNMDITPNEEVNYFADLYDPTPRVINPKVEVELVKVNNDTMDLNTMINNITSKNSIELLKKLDKLNYSAQDYKILANMLKNSYNK